MYIKEIVAGESYIELGGEEAESLKKALAGPLGDTDLGHMNEIINNTYDVKELDEALAALNLDDDEIAQDEAAAGKAAVADEASATSQAAATEEKV